MIIDFIVTGYSLMGLKMVDMLSGESVLLLVREVSGDWDDEAWEDLALDSSVWVGSVVVVLVRA